MGSGSSGSKFVSNTSGSHDGGYNGGSGNYRGIGENLGSLGSKYKYKDGYFGNEGSGMGKRRIESDDPLATAHDFYDTATYGGVESLLPTGEGTKSQMRDGTVVSIREVSKSPDRSPAVDISIRNSSNSPGLKAQKIHFVKKKGKKQ